MPLFLNLLLLKQESAYSSLVDIMTLTTLAEVSYVLYSVSGKSNRNRNRNRNRKLKTSKAQIKSQAHQGTSLLTSAATNQRGVSKGRSRETQVQFPEYQEGYLSGFTV